MRLIAALTLPLAALMLVGSATPAPAQSSRELDNRLQRLEREISTLNRQIFGGQRTPNSVNPHARNRNMADPTPEQLPRDFAANFELRLGELEQQIRNLTGRLERQEGQYRRMNTEMMRRFDDLALRLSDAEQKLVAAPALAPAPPQAATQTTATAPDVPAPAATPEITPSAAALTAPATPPPAAGSPDEAYQTAFNALQQGSYDTAEGQFRQFVTSNPTHDLADNAQYWLAETYYVRRQYDAAAVAFAQAVKQYPDGNKTPDSLLKLGMSLGALGQPQKACIAFAQLQARSATIGGTLRRRLGDEQARYQCR